MDELIFIVGMLIYGLISRISFVARFGSSLGVYISDIDIKEKYLQTKLDFVAFITYFAVLIWGFINIFWVLTVFIMLGALFTGGLLVTDGNFRRFVAIKPQLEFFIILIGVYLWRESIVLIFK